MWLWGETRQAARRPIPPQQMSGLPKIVAIAASGYSYSWRRRLVWAWGRNVDQPHHLPLHHVVRAGPQAVRLPIRCLPATPVAAGGQPVERLFASGLGDPSGCRETLPIEAHSVFASTSTVTTVQELFTDKIGPGWRGFPSADVAQSGLLDTLKAVDGNSTSGAAPDAVSGVAHARWRAGQRLGGVSLLLSVPDGKPNTHFYTANPGRQDGAAGHQPGPNGDRQAAAARGRCLLRRRAQLHRLPPVPRVRGLGRPERPERLPAGLSRLPNNRSNLNDGNHRMSTQLG